MPYCSYSPVGGNNWPYSNLLFELSNLLGKTTRTRRNSCAA